MQKTIEDFQSAEKRITARFIVHYLTDIYLHDEIIYSTVIDISETGIGIVIPHRLYPSEELKLRINCNLTYTPEDRVKKINIFLKARVMWVKEIDDKNMYRTGLEIIDIAEDSLQKLQRHIQSLISRAFE